MAVDSDILKQIEEFLTVTRARVADGITVADLTQITLGGMRLVIGLLDRVNMPGADKKAEVLKLVAYLFDQFSDSCVPFLSKPLWWIVKPAVRALVLSAASGAVEFLLPVVRSAR
jgi:hypothetical protein